MDCRGDPNLNTIDSDGNSVGEVPCNTGGCLGVSQDVPMAGDCSKFTMHENTCQLVDTHSHVDNSVNNSSHGTLSTSDSISVCLTKEELVKLPRKDNETTRAFALNLDCSDSVNKFSENKVTNGKVLDIQNESVDDGMSSSHHDNETSTPSHVDEAPPGSHTEEASPQSQPDDEASTSHNDKAPSLSPSGELSESDITKMLSPSQSGEENISADGDSVSPCTSSSSSPSFSKKSKLSKASKNERSVETKNKPGRKRKLNARQSTFSSSNKKSTEVETATEHAESVEVSNGPKKGRKRKDLVSPLPSKKKQPSTTYESEISPDQQGIKLFIKKSSTNSHRSKRKSRNNSQKTKEKTDEKKSKKVRWSEEDSNEGNDEEREQSEWGLRLPDTALHKIFMMLTHEEGCLPFLPRASRVCRLWYQAAITPSLWHNIDLSGSWIKEKCKNTHHLKWLCENRLARVQELNLTGWKIPAISSILKTISDCCHDLRGLNMMGWKGLSGEHLKFLISNCPLLARVDLSSICPEISNNKGACSLMSLTNLSQELGERLTHLILANNRLSGLPQIITSLATHCPNLQVLDLSNIKTGSVTTAPLHIERLQKGCQKLRVLRITNSQFALSQIPLKEQAASPGFPMLEELSVAGTGVVGLCSTPIVDDNSIERILKSSHKLRLLDVRGCTRISDSSLVRVPAWDLEHLFLSGCYVTRLRGNGLELIAQKWSHSLVEMDLAWSTDTESLDMAVCALAECDGESRLRVLDLCGSSVSLEPVKKVLANCQNLVSLNLASCRALPRGIKRLYEGDEVNKLLSSLEKRMETEASVDDGADGQS